jgi:3-hydroxyisobutyrate dehydrogenase-like beta-hydroxyacid dehydrogenase
MYSFVSRRSREAICRRRGRTRRETTSPGEGKATRRRRSDCRQLKVARRSTLVISLKNDLNETGGNVRISFLGLGKMGRALVPHLLNAGHFITVWNRNNVITEKFAAQGAEVARSAADAVKTCEVAFTLLLNDAALEDVLFEGGVLDAMPRGAIHVSVSTISVALAKRLTVEHEKRGLRHVGAPVFGRPNVAAEGKLWVVAGGAKDALEKVRSLLEIYSRGITVVSEEPWRAHAMKLAGNFSVAAMVATLSEAMTVAESMDVSPEVFVEMANSATFRSPLYEMYGKTLTDPPKEIGASIELGEKDIRLFREAAAANGVKTPLAELMESNFDAALEAGMKDDDWAAGYYALVRQRSTLRE